jgi:hypothetical protein
LGAPPRGRRPRDQPGVPRAATGHTGHAKDTAA